MIAIESEVTDPTLSYLETNVREQSESNIHDGEGLGNGKGRNFVVEDKEIDEEREPREKVERTYIRETIESK